MRNVNTEIHKLRLILDCVETDMTPLYKSVTTNKTIITKLLTTTHVNTRSSSHKNHFRVEIISSDKLEPSTRIWVYAKKFHATLAPITLSYQRDIYRLYKGANYTALSLTSYKFAVMVRGNSRIFTFLLKRSIEFKCAASLRCLRRMNFWILICLARICS